MDINDRLDAYYTNVITKKLGVDHPLIAIPQPSRGDITQINRVFLAALASLALQVPHLQAFHQRLTNAVYLRTNGSEERGVSRLRETDVMRALEDIWNEQNNVPVIADAYLSPETARRNKISKTQATGDTSSIINSPTPLGRSRPTSTHDASSSRSNRRHISDSAEVSLTKRRKTARQVALERGSTVHHYDFFPDEKPKNLYIPSMNPSTIDTPLRLTEWEIDLLKYPVEVASGKQVRRLVVWTY
jgi:hypothetical protein